MSARMSHRGGVNVASRIELSARVAPTSTVTLQARTRAAIVWADSSSARLASSWHLEAHAKGATAIRGLGPTRIRRRDGPEEEALLLELL